MEASEPGEVLTADGGLQVRVDDGLALVGGHALTLSVREFELLVVLVRQSGRIVARERLFELVWGGTLRPGDRSIDVYVHKLRVKLGQALPGWRFIHTHVGFGYRFAPGPSHAFHTTAAGSLQDG